MSFKIIVTMSVTRCFSQHNTTPDLQDQDQDLARFLVSDRSCCKTGGLRPHHSFILTTVAAFSQCYSFRSKFLMIRLSTEIETVAHPTAEKNFNKIRRRIFLNYSAHRQTDNDRNITSLAVMMKESSLRAVNGRYV